MECRTLLFPETKKAPAGVAVAPRHNIQAAAEHPASVYPRESYRAKQQRLFRQQQQQKYSTPAPTSTNISPAQKQEVLTKLVQSSSQTAEEPPRLLPKNVVLMSLMEAAQPKHGIKNEDAEEDAAYESGDDDDQVLTGLSVLSHACGTYAVKRPEGVWVYDGKPPSLLLSTESSCESTATTTASSKSSTQRMMNHNNNNKDDTTTSLLKIQQCSSASSADPPGKSPTKENQPPLSTSQKIRKASSLKFGKRYTTNGSTQEGVPANKSRSSSFKSLTAGTPLLVDNTHPSSSSVHSVTRGSSSSSSQRQHACLKKNLFPAEPLPLEKLDFGDTVQVVCLVDHGTVAQLARGLGFVRLVNRREDTDDKAAWDGQIEALVKGRIVLFWMNCEGFYYSSCMRSSRNLTGYLFVSLRYFIITQNSRRTYRRSLPDGRYHTFHW